MNKEQLIVNNDQFAELSYQQVIDGCERIELKVAEIKKAAQERKHLDRDLLRIIHTDAGKIERRGTEASTRRTLSENLRNVEEK